MTEEPLLCIAGTNSNIKIYNVKQGKLVKVGSRSGIPAPRGAEVANHEQTLVGHGGVS